MRPQWLIVIAIASCGAACEKRHGYDDDRIGNRAAPRRAEAPRVHLFGADGAAHVVTVEVVRTEADVRKGLMFRRHLEPDAGMLFVMGEERVHTFWMKNTYIPLDMIFIAKDLRVAGVAADAVPQTETLRSVERPSSYVLEVNAGWAKAHGIGAGARVRFENFEP